PVIANHFMQDFSLTQQKQIPHLLSNTLHMLQSYEWPGNVRALLNIVERMILFNEKETISAEEVKEVFPIDFKQVKETARTGLLHEDRAAMEKERIIETRDKTYGNKSAAAKLLGISRVSLYNKM